MIKPAADAAPLTTKEAASEALRPQLASQGLNLIAVGSIEADAGDNTRVQQDPDILAVPRGTVENG